MTGFKMATEPAPRARIAICEDERIVALDIRAFLTRNGYEVVGLYASAEALIDEASRVRPELVLMDIHLQGKLDGIEASALLSERWAIPVILLTAYADDPTIERAKLTHPYAYILKPYDERELKTAISIGLYRASMERRLRRSEERYRALFDDGLAATMIADATGRLIEANKAFRRLAPDASSIRTLLANEADAEALAAAIASGKAYGPAEHRVACSGEEESWALVSAASITLPDGTDAFQCQAFDVTERKTLRDQLVHAQRLSALGRLAGGVAHDFNNVLTAVLGYARLLRADFEAEGRGLEELNGIERAAMRAANLARQLLMFSRRDKADPERFSLSDLARDCERMLGRIIGDDASLSVRPGSGDDCVMADRSRIEQAVVNLVANARDALPNGGRITVVTGTTVVPEELPGPVEPIPVGRWAFIEVCDDGIGIAPEARCKIFQPFFTTKSPERGTGLGLSTVLSIVQGYGGRVALDSEPGAGTTVRLLFPIAAQAGGNAGSPAAASAGRTPAGLGDPLAHVGMGRGRAALVVETNDSVRAILEALLDRAGFRVVSASHPGEALLLAERQRPDLVIADLVMPLMGGEELADRLRTSFGDMPALYLRGTESEYGPGEGGDPMGLRECLDKPFGEDELLEALERLAPPVSPA